MEKFLKPYMKFMTDDRDLFLRMVLSEEILDEKNQNKKLCIKYGAKHMPVLAKTLLSDFDYELIHQRNVLAIAKNKCANFEEINTGYDVAYNKLRKIDEVQTETTTEEWVYSPLSISPQNITFSESVNSNAFRGTLPKLELGMEKEFGKKKKDYKFKARYIEAKEIVFAFED